MHSTVSSSFSNVFGRIHTRNFAPASTVTLSESIVFKPSFAFLEMYQIIQSATLLSVAW